MSHDLFAAFGSPEPVHSKAPTQGLSDPHVQPQMSGSSGFVNDNQTIDHKGPNELFDDEDDFGDFEDAAATTTSPVQAAGSGYPPPKPTSPKPQTSKKPNLPFELKQPSSNAGAHPFAGNMDILFSADDDGEYNAGKDEMDDLANNPEAAMEYSKRIIAEQQTDHEWTPKVQTAPKTAPSTSGQEPNKLRKKSGYVPARDPAVLFDADDPDEAEDDADDFGDFAAGPSSSGDQGTAAAATQEQQTAMPALDLLGLDDATTNDRTVPETTSEVQEHSRNVTVPTVATNLKNADSQYPDDDWDDFEEPVFSDPKPSMSNLTTSKPHVAPSKQPTNKSTRANQVKETSLLPPTNIPPPATLLSLFPPLITSAQTTLFTPLSRLSLPQRQTLLSHPATHTFLRNYLTLALALAHILAGRRLRWKRDTYLAQGMRIGPAGGKGGGMKLAGVDRGEVAKEEREVVEVVAVWRGQVGRVRTAVAAVAGGAGVGGKKKAGKGLPTVPEIAEQMPVKVLKGSEGAMTAPLACALCGLRREERVSKVDVEVEDSFGEWWVDGASMHLVCREFWEEHKGKLRSR